MAMVSRAEPDQLETTTKTKVKQTTRRDNTCRGGAPAVVHDVWFHWGATHHG